MLSTTRGGGVKEVITKRSLQSSTGLEGDFKKKADGDKVGGFQTAGERFGVKEKSINQCK